MLQYLMLVLLAVVLVLSQANQVELGDQVIEWGECPPDQDTSSFTMTCANVTLPLNYDDPSMGNVTAFVRRFYVEQPTNSSIWMIAGGPGDSTRMLVPACDYFLAMNPTYTCYNQDARGTGLSSFMSCGKNGQPVAPFNPYNETVMNQYEDCFTQIITEYGTDLQYYSTYNAAHDLVSVVNLVNPELVHIYAQSYGTYSLNTYLQIPSARADAIVLDGPVPPNRWPLENNAEWVSKVAQDVAYGCASGSSVCENRLSRMAHIPQLVMDSIIDTTLPCVQNVTWLDGGGQGNGQFWTSIYNNYVAGGANDRATAHIALGPMWFRLHRCNASDIEQLEYFNQVMQVKVNYPVQWEDYSLGAAINIAVNELYSYSPNPLSFEHQKLRSSRMFGSAGVELLIAYAKNMSNPAFPPYQVNPTVFKHFATPPCPMIIMVGTMDVNTENGLGYWFQQGLGPMAELYNVPYNAHVTLSFDNPCPDSIMLNFFNSLGTDYDTSCLAEMASEVPDWAGSTQSSQNFSMSLFGTYDLWNDGFAVDVPPPVPPTCTNTTIYVDGDCDCDDDAPNYETGFVITMSIMGLAFVGIAGYFCMFFYKPKKPPSLSERNSARSSQQQSAIRNPLNGQESM